MMLPIWKSFDRAKQVWGKSIHRQISFSFSLISLFIFLVFGYAFFVYERHILYEQGTERTIRLAQLLSLSSVPHMLSDDLASLTEIVNEAKQDKDTKAIFILSIQGEVLASSNNAHVAKDVPSLTSQLLTSLGGEARVLRNSAELIDVVVPIRVSNRNIGWLRIERSREFDNANLFYIAESGAAFVLLLMLSIYFLASRLAYRLTNGLNRMVSVAENAERGLPFARLDINRADEIGVLARHLYKMLETIGEEKQRNVEGNASLKRESEKNLALLRNASDGIHILDYDGNVIEVSDSFCAMLGYQREEVIGMNVSKWDVGFADRSAQLAKLREQFDKPVRSQFETRHRRKDGTVFDVEVSGYPLKLEDKQVLFNSSRDITERKLLEERISQLAYFDLLTKLPNRSMLEDRLKQAMANSKRTGKYGALMFLDLDNFKPLNDTWGHALGDLLLIDVADRIRNSVREADTVARFGGDEFVVVLNELDADRTKSTEQAITVADKIRLSISETYRLTLKEEGKTDIKVEHHCTASIGLTLFIGHEKTVGNLFKNADSAMYRAKDAGRNLIRISAN